MRVWLEPNESDTESYASWYPDGDRLVIADCHRRVSLWFSSYDKRAARKSLRKLARLQKVIDAMKADLEEALQ